MPGTSDGLIRTENTMSYENKIFTGTVGLFKGLDRHNEMYKSMKAPTKVSTSIEEKST